MKGSCFCGKIHFEVNAAVKELYQCHCSECRKTTGTAANAGFIIHKNNFNWLKGESSVKSFIKDTGYRVNFCTNCGSVVPNAMTMLEHAYWVPAGAIDSDFSATIAHHIYVDSKADWDDISPIDSTKLAKQPKLHSTLPDELSELLPADLATSLNSL